MTTSTSHPFDHALGVLEFPRVRAIIVSLARSEEGRERLASLAPLADPAAIRAILAETGEMMRALMFDESPPPPEPRDLRALFPVLRVQGSRLDTEAIAAAGDTLALAREMRRYFETRADAYPLIWTAARNLAVHEDLERAIRRAIGPDFTVTDDASAELRSIRRRLSRARSMLRELVDSALDTLSDDVVSERLVTLRNGRFVIPVRDSMKKKVPGAVHDRSQTGRTLFVEPLAAIEGNNQVTELELAEREEIDRILTALTAGLAEVVDDIRSNQDILVRLDVIGARGRYGAITGGVIPIISDTPRIDLRRARHPLLDWKQRRHDGAPVVALDAALGGDTRTVVVTGPNAGGKTVALKTVGLMTAMGAAGLPLPAGPDTTVFAPTGLFADIGDEQSIENDLSTFSSHMTQIVTILREAGPGALALFDELGGGTNPADGEAIALAVLRRLTGAGALTMATTHHDGLKAFAHETPGVMNASMEFDTDQLRPTFAFRAGIPGSSYAFEIARRLGMPASVLGDAERIAGGERKTLEGLIAEMEEHVHAADEARRALETERRDVEARRRKYDETIAEFTAKKQSMLRDALDESKKIVADAGSRIESAVRDIREKKASRDAIVTAKQAVIQTEETLRTMAETLPAKDAPARTRVKVLEKGCAIWSATLGTNGVVEEVMDGGKRVRIRAGKSPATIVVKAADLYAGDVQPKKRERQGAVMVTAARPESFDLDIRGMTFDDALMEIEPFLDRLHMDGAEWGTIIHGKGTGALRKKVTAYLRTHRLVAEMRLGDWNEGGAGVTVVTLRK